MTKVSQKFLECNLRVLFCPFPPVWASRSQFLLRRELDLLLRKTRIPVFSLFTKFINATPGLALCQVAHLLCTHTTRKTLQRCPTAQVGTEVWILIRKPNPNQIIGSGRFGTNWSVNTAAALKMLSNVELHDSCFCKAGERP